MFSRGSATASAKALFVLGLCIASATVWHFNFADAPVSPSPRSHEPALAAFDLSAGGIKTLVAALGGPWSQVTSPIQQSHFPQRKLRTVYMVGPTGALTLKVQPSGRVSSFVLQSGAIHTCGHPRHLVPALSLVVRGLGLQALRQEEERSLQSAWINASAVRMARKKAVIGASSNGCVYWLSFSAISQIAASQARSLAAT